MARGGSEGVGAGSAPGPDIPPSLPVIMAVFWSNFAYVALRWTENLMARRFMPSRRVDEHLPLIFLVMATIAMAVEAYASQYGMLSWKAEPVLTLWGGTPVIVPF